MPKYKIGFDDDNGWHECEQEGTNPLAAIENAVMSKSIEPQPSTRLYVQVLNPATSVGFVIEMWIEKSNSQESVPVTSTGILKEV
jgi:hypothetical protein